MIVSWRLTDQVVTAVHQPIAAVTWYLLLPLLLSELLSRCVWHLQDATQLALKIVTSYGLSDIGITTYAAPGASLGFMRKSFEVLPFDGWRHCCLIVPNAFLASFMQTVQQF